MSRDVGVGQLVEELEQRGDRLPFEIGAFVALEACEGLLQESVKLVADDVRVTQEGSVVVAGSAERAEPDEAARSLVSVLARLLVAAGPGVPPYLLQLVKESTTGHNPRDLRHLHDAIEASLIPINRGASRRVLARLVRESDRPPAPEVPQVDPRELDAELDELLRDPVTRTLEPTQAELPPQEEEGPITERIRMPLEASPDTGAATGAGTDADTDAAVGAGAGAGAGTGTDSGTATATGAVTDAVTDAGTAADSAPHTFPPPAPDLDLQPETLRVPSSEPAMRSASVPVPDLRPPPAARPAVVVAAMPEQPRQPGPEPITATIRKWQPPAAEAKAASETEAESASVAASVPVAASVAAPVPVSAPVPASVAAPESVSVPESPSVPVSESVIVAES
ncbi:MAG: hypothetical protein JRJ80_02820, partial [Deltaproteobacteria bacterium]|nr:hypothetical protein [Deltaproteobacteria bacterium]